MDAAEKWLQVWKQLDQVTEVPEVFTHVMFTHVQANLVWQKVNRNILQKAVIYNTLTQKTHRQDE